MALDYDRVRPTRQQQLPALHSHRHRPTKFEMDEYYDEAEVANLYHWLDRLPLGGTKKDIVKDFQDGVKVEEILHHYLGTRIKPKGCTPACSTRQQKSNWYYLKGKLLKHLDLELDDDDISAITRSNPDTNTRVIEKVLMQIRMKLDMFLERKGRTEHEVDLSLALEKQVKEKSKALKSTRRHPPEKVISPRKYNRTEIPHDHPDRSAYFPDVKPPPVYESKMLVVPSSENVPRSLLEEKEMENLAKNETIKILNAKVQSLEHLLRLKDMRLRDLTSQMHETSRLYHVTTKSLR